MAKKPFDPNPRRSILSDPDGAYDDARLEADKAYWLKRWKEEEESDGN